MTLAREDRTPIWFWIVAVVALLWNAFGGYDYTMSHLQGEAYYRQVGMTEAQIAYMAAYPTWMHGAWALGVWGAVALALPICSARKRPRPRRGRRSKIDR